MAVRKRVYVISIKGRIVGKEEQNLTSFVPFIYGTKDVNEILKTFTIWERRKKLEEYLSAGDALVCDAELLLPDDEERLNAHIQARAQIQKTKIKPEEEETDYIDLNMALPLAPISPPPSRSVIKQVEKKQTPPLVLTHTMPAVKSAKREAKLRTGLLNLLKGNRYTPVLPLAAALRRKSEDVTTMLLLMEEEGVVRRHREGGAWKLPYTNKRTVAPLSKTWEEMIIATLDACKQPITSNTLESDIKIKYEEFLNRNIHGSLSAALSALKYRKKHPRFRWEGTLSRKNSLQYKYWTVPPFNK